jgi:hypothetical protein
MRVLTSALQRMRRLIVNGGRLRQSAGFNERIIRCFERGMLTSAS